MPNPVLGPAQVGDTFKVTLNQVLYGQRVMNVLWYEIDNITGGPFDRWDVQEAVANKILSAGDVMEKLNACQTVDLANLFVRVTSYRTLADRQPYTEVTNTDNGDLVPSAGTANVAASIEKRAVGSAGKPRTGIGRLQVGGVPQDAYVAGNLTNAYMVPLAALASQMEANLSVLATITLVPVIVTWGPTNILNHVIFQCEPKREVRDMRRRTVGRGI